MSARLRGRHGFVFNILYRGEYTTVPVAKNILNTFDYMGMLVGLERLPGERNAAYRNRMIDVFIHRGGPHQTGLINAITRELGLKQYDAVDISSTLERPRIEVGDVFVRLSDGDLVLAEFDTYSRDSVTYQLGGLVDAISDIEGFTAELCVGTDEHERSTVLLVSDSRQKQIDVPIYQIHRNILPHTSIVRDSLKFSLQGNTIFIRARVSEAEMVLPGDYYVDYTNGFVISYSLPVIGVTCSYQYNAFPVTLRASPVILQEFNSDTLRNRIFQQVLQSDGTTVDGLPTSEAADMINELMAAKGLLWGE